MLNWRRYPPLTIGLIGVCVLVALISNFGSAPANIHYLFISTRGEGLTQVLEGEVWRLLTPILIHFGLLHLAFNMLWLWDLGGLIEYRRGLRYFAVFVVAVGVASNLAQYLISASPWFGGMSGVVYGLLGYVWMQGKFNPRFGYVLHKHIVIMMLAWYVLCWTGLLGPIANWAHTGGLLLGVIWGFVERDRR